MVDTFSNSGLTLTARSFSGRKCFSSAPIRMHGVEVVGYVKRRGGVDMAKCDIAFKVLKV